MRRPNALARHSAIGPSRDRRNFAERSSLSTEFTGPVAFDQDVTETVSYEGSNNPITSLWLLGRGLGARHLEPIADGFCERHRLAVS